MSAAFPGAEVCVCVCVCVRACVRACVHAHTRVCVCVCVCTYTHHHTHTSWPNAQTHVMAVHASCGAHLGVAESVFHLSNTEAISMPTSTQDFFKVSLSCGEHRAVRPRFRAHLDMYAFTHARTHARTHTLSLSLSRAGQRHTGLRRGASSQSEGAATRARSAPAHPSNHARSPRVLACRSPCRWAAARTQRRAAGRTSHTTCLDTPRAGRGCPAAPPIAIVQRVDGARRLRHVPGP